MPRLRLWMRFQLMVRPRTKAGLAARWVCLYAMTATSAFSILKDGLAAQTSPVSIGMAGFVFGIGPAERVVTYVLHSLAKTDETSGDERADEDVWRSAPGWRVIVMASLTTPPARERWLEHLAESLYDYEPRDHHAVIRNFLRTAPIVIIRSWTLDLPRVVSGTKPADQRTNDPRPGR